MSPSRGRAWSSKEAVAFHAQQTVEKALKAVLVSHQVEFPKNHDIERLLDLVAVCDPDLAQTAADAAELTPFGVEYRYPGEYPSVSRAAAALVRARHVCEEAARRIGVE